MLKLEAAIKIILNSTPRQKSESIRLTDSFRRIISYDLVAKTDMPHFEKSAMDGFAVRSRDTKGAPVKLKIVENLPAGKIPRFKIGKGTCAKIMTGSPLPQGADAVVMIEDTQTAGKNKITVLKEVEPDENVCLKGEDFKKGNLLIKKGEAVGMAEAAVLASQGEAKVKVFKTPRIAILATGDELVEPAKPLTAGHIRNTNASMLISILKYMNLETKYLGIAKDKKSDLNKKIRQGLKSDILVISGAVSMGEFDFVPAVLKKLGVKILLHKVAIKPGKPLLFAKKGRTLIFGLPGNPVSSLLGFHLFIRPTIQKMMGMELKGLDVYQGVLQADFKKKKGRRQFYPCRVVTEKDKFLLYPIKHAGSGDINSIIHCNSFMMIDEHKTFVPQNAKIDFFFI